MEIDSSVKKLSKKLLDCLTAAANLISHNNLPGLKTPSKPEGNVPLALALSGGGDSTALLLSLSKIAPSFGFRLLACHVNHGLRGEESEQDAEFCKAVCETLNIECEIINISPVEIHKTKNKHLSEDTLRQLRYARLIDFARSKNISFLITAHTLDDQAETILFRLFRGTAISGLKGIATCRNLGDGLFLLRPLLKLSKIECQEFLEREGFAFRNDSSNQNEIYTRNYIRHKILPNILERFPDLALHLDSLSEIARAEDNYLEDISVKILEQFQTDNSIWTLELFNKQHLALKRRILGQALKQRKIEVSFKRINEILFLASTESPLADFPLYLNLNQDWRLKRTVNCLNWQELNKNRKNYHFASRLINVPGRNLIPEINYELIIELYSDNSKQAQITANPLQLSLNGHSILADLSRTNPPLLLRERRPGDRIQPLGMSQIVKLKKYLHTHKNIDKHHHYPQLLLADQNEVLWLPGIGMSEKIKVIQMPSHILKWREMSPDGL